MKQDEELDDKRVVSILMRMEELKVFSLFEHKNTIQLRRSADL